MAEPTIWANSLGKEWKGVNWQVRVRDKLAYLFTQIQTKMPPSGKEMPMMATGDGVAEVTGLSPQSAGGNWYWTKRSVFAYNQHVQGMALGGTVGEPTDEDTDQCNVAMGTLMAPIQINWQVAPSEGVGKLQEGGDMWTDRVATIDMVFTTRIGTCLRYGKKFPLAYVRTSCTTATSVEVFWTGELRAARNIVVDVIDPATGNKRGVGGDSNTITAINYQTHTLTMTSSTFTKGDLIVPEDSYDLGFYGLADYLSDGSPIGSTVIGDYYICPGTAAWGLVNRASYPEEWLTLILRNGLSAGSPGPAGKLREWGADQLNELLDLQSMRFGDDHPINVIWMPGDLYAYMIHPDNKDRFYQDEFIRQLTKGESKEYLFGYNTKAVYMHPKAADGGAQIIVDDRAWPHCVVCLAMYSDDDDVIGTRWAKPPHWLGDGKGSNIENYLQFLVNYSKVAAYRGTMAVMMSMVGAKPNAHCILADCLGNLNESWNRPGL